MRVFFRQLRRDSEKEGQHFNLFESAVVGVYADDEVYGGLMLQGGPKLVLGLEYFLEEGRTQGLSCHNKIFNAIFRAATAGTLKRGLE